MKTLELEIVQGFFFYPHYAFRYIFVKLDFGKHSDKYIFYTLRFDCSFAAANTIKPQLL